MGRMTWFMALEFKINEQICLTNSIGKIDQLYLTTTEKCNRTGRCGRPSADQMTLLQFTCSNTISCHNAHIRSFVHSKNRCPKKFRRKLKWKSKETIKQKNSQQCKPRIHLLFTHLCPYYSRLSVNCLKIFNWNVVRPAIKVN